MMKGLLVITIIALSLATVAQTKNDVIVQKFEKKLSAKSTERRGDTTSEAPVTTSEAPVTTSEVPETTTKAVPKPGGLSNYFLNIGCSNCYVITNFNNNNGILDLQAAKLPKDGFL